MTLSKWRKTHWEYWQLVFQQAGEQFERYALVDFGLTITACTRQQGTHQIKATQINDAQIWKLCVAVEDVKIMWGAGLIYMVESSYQYVGLSDV